MMRRPTLSSAVWLLAAPLAWLPGAGRAESPAPATAPAATAPPTQRATPGGALRLDLAQAQAQAAQVSGSVRSAQLGAQARALQSEAVQYLGAPSLSLSGFAGRINGTATVDTSAAAEALNPLLSGVDAMLPNVTLPRVPDSVSRTETVDLASANLTTVWPVYAGGRIEAVKALMQGREQEAKADAVEAADKLATGVAQRYFTVQLAAQALALRQAAQDGISEHQRNARTLEGGGLLSRAERLRADVALDTARREAQRAAGDLALAQVALRRLLALEQPVQAATPLFVHREPVGSLEDFIAAARGHHPAWQKIAAKRSQADAALAAQGGAFAPTVLALGSVNVAHRESAVLRSNWAVGLAVSVPLFSRLDHGRLRDAARLQQQQVEASNAQAERDIPTLVEQHWRAMEAARVQYLTGASGIELAQEQVRLQTAAFQAGQAPSTDVTDARLQLAKTQIERSQAAFDYVMALARLLEACGQPERLATLAASAEEQLPLAAP